MDNDQYGRDSVNPNQHSDFPNKYGRPGIPTIRARHKEDDIHGILKKEIIAQGDSSGSIDAGANFKYGFDDNSAHGGSAVGPRPSTGGAPQQSTQPKPTVGPARGPVGIKDSYIWFDSVTAEDVSALGQGDISFSIPLRNNGVPIDNIIEMEIGEFYFPDIPKPGYEPSYYFYALATAGISQMLNSQAIQGTGNFRFHWEFDVLAAGISKQFVPINRKFIFGKPARDLQVATFTFRAPDKRIPIPVSVYTVRSIAAIPGIFEAIDGSGVPTAHDLPGGSSTVYFVNYNPSDNNANTFIPVTNPDGNLVTNITFSRVQLSALLAPPPPQTTTITTPDGNPSAEVTTYTVNNNLMTNFGGRYVLLYGYNSPTVVESPYAFWFNVDGLSTAPSVPGFTLIQVALVTGDTTAQIATALSNAINTVPTLFTAVPVGPVVTVTGVNDGNVTNSTTNVANAAITIAIVDGNYDNNRARMIVGSRRFMFQVRFRSLIENITNHIVPV